jgi:hypothetical protein
MLKQNVIEHCHSPWVSGICLVRKKDGTIRFCVDLRALNSVTIFDAYPLPRIDQTLDHLANSHYYHLLDLASGYWQLKLNEFDAQKTSFRIPGQGQFKFTVMPFGLKNAPASFQRLMEAVLNGLGFEKCLVYLDDVCILGKTFSESLENLCSVLTRFRQANLKLKPVKCKFFQTEIVFLGHQVSARGISCDPSKIQCIKDWPTPTNKHEILSWLGICGYYRKMIDRFAEIALPLTKLTRKKAKFKWGQSENDAFEKLKSCLINSPILGFPDENGSQFILDTDASAEVISGIISQVQNGHERVLAYGSKVLNAAQQNYCTTKRELLAIVHFVQHYKHYLLGKKFLIRSDHKSLTYLQKFKEPEGLLARWISILGLYEFEIQYREGSKH